MNNKAIQPVILGRGMAGQAIAKSLAIINSILWTGYRLRPSLGYLVPTALAKNGIPMFI